MAGRPPPLIESELSTLVMGSDDRDQNGAKRGMASFPKEKSRDFDKKPSFNEPAKDRREPRRVQSEPGGLIDHFLWGVPAQDVLGGQQDGIWSSSWHESPSGKTGVTGPTAGLESSSSMHSGSEWGTWMSHVTAGSSSRGASWTDVSVSRLRRGIEDEDGASRWERELGIVRVPEEGEDDLLEEEEEEEKGGELHHTVTAPPGTVAQMRDHSNGRGGRSLLHASTAPANVSGEEREKGLESHFPSSVGPKISGADDEALDRNASRSSMLSVSSGSSPSRSTSVPSMHPQSSPLRPLNPDSYSSCSSMVPPPPPPPPSYPPPSYPPSAPSSPVRNVYPSPYPSPYHYHPSHAPPPPPSSSFQSPVPPPPPGSLPPWVTSSTTATSHHHHPPASAPLTPPWMMMSVPPPHPQSRPPLLPSSPQTPIPPPAESFGAPHARCRTIVVFDLWPSDSAASLARLIGSSEIARVRIVRDESSAQRFAFLAFRTRHGAVDGLAKLMREGRKSAWATDELRAKFGEESPPPTQRDLPTI